LLSRGDVELLFALGVFDQLVGNAFFDVLFRKDEFVRKCTFKSFNGVNEEVRESSSQKLV
jgi:hypothetical protein